jgi:hypothetical protein
MTPLETFCDLTLTTVVACLSNPQMVHKRRFTEMQFQIFFKYWFTLLSDKAIILSQTVLSDFKAEKAKRQLLVEVFPTPTVPKVCQHFISE